MRGVRLLGYAPALAVSLVSMASACSSPEALQGQGALCFLVTDCALNLGCVLQSDGTRRCSSDLTPIQFPAEAGGGSDATLLQDVAVADATSAIDDAARAEATAPQPDVGTPPEDASTPVPDVAAPLPETGSLPEASPLPESGEAPESGSLESGSDDSAAPLD